MIITSFLVIIELLKVIEEMYKKNIHIILKKEFPEFDKKLKNLIMR